MQPLSPLERSIAPPGPAVRTATGDGAFAALLAGVGLGTDADARQSPAPPAGKRLPDATPDPALLLAALIPSPVMPVAPPVVETPPTPPVGAAVALPLPAGMPPIGEAVAVPTPLPVAATPAETIDALPLAPPLADTPPARVEGKTLPVATPDLPVPPRQRMAGEAAAPVVAIAPPAPAQVAQAASALVVEAANDDRDAPPPRDGEAATPWTPLGTPDIAPRPVAAPAAADGARLDLSDDRWMQGMIDHIETVRGEAGMGGETRIRLSPDALGTVEIVLTHGEDGMQVRFASDTPDAGRLIADAQPRLAELAAERGLKLGGMQVDVGSRQGNAPRDPAPVPARPRKPMAVEAADPVNDDIRIA